VLGLVLALLAALSWGVSDFLGGVATRSIPVIRVLAVSQPFGLALCTVALVVSGQSLPTGWHLLQALAAGVAAVVALGLLYLALARGNAVLVAPVAATGAAVPVAIGIALGDPVTMVTGIATGLALAGIVAASWESGDGTGAEPATGHGTGATIGLSLGAALATGLYLTLINLASESGQYLGVVEALRLTASVLAVIGYLCWHARTRNRRAERPAGSAAGSRPGLLLLAMAGVGVTDAVAESCYAGASTRGALSVVSVLAGLYPVVTVGLSLLVLRQRVQLVQGIGAVAALTGVLLFTASS
jgi:drug/metabolite transporter (DMT)-like permease